MNVLVAEALEQKSLPENSFILLTSGISAEARALVLQETMAGEIEIKLDYSLNSR